MFKISGTFLRYRYHKFLSKRITRLHFFVVTYYIKILNKPAVSPNVWKLSFLRFISYQSETTYTSENFVIFKIDVWKSTSIIRKQTHKMTNVCLAYDEFLESSDTIVITVATATTMHLASIIMFFCLVVNLKESTFEKSMFFFSIKLHYYKNIFDDHFDLLHARSWSSEFE